MLPAVRWGTAQSGAPWRSDGALKHCVDSGAAGRNLKQGRWQAGREGCWREGGVVGRQEGCSRACAGVTSSACVYSRGLASAHVVGAQPRAYPATPSAAQDAVCLFDTHYPRPCLHHSSTRSLWGSLSDVTLVCSRWYCFVGVFLLADGPTNCGAPHEACLLYSRQLGTFALTPRCLPAHCDAGVGMCNCVMMISHEHAPSAYLVAPLKGPAPFPCPKLASCPLHASFVWRPPPSLSQKRRGGGTCLLSWLLVLCVGVSVSPLHAGAMRARRINDPSV